MDQTLQERIKDLETQKNKLEHPSLEDNIINRISGTLNLGIGALAIYLGTKYNFPVNIIPYLIGSEIIADGLAMAFTGEKHYVLFRLTRVHPKYELEKLKDEYNGE